MTAAASLFPADTGETINGVVEAIRFQNQENGFCVLSVKISGKVLSRSSSHAVVGHAPGVNEGERILAIGSWKTDKRYGEQFDAKYIKTSPPSTKDGILKYLCSGLIKGIGPGFAKKLVDKFGEDLFDVIDEQPARLGEIPGVGPKRIAKIVEAWEAQRAVRDIMKFLYEHGAAVGLAARIYKSYGADAIRVISENPYQLARDVWGVGFTTADKIAEKSGIPPDSIIRVRAGISYALDMASKSDGHCALPRGELLRATRDLLDTSETPIPSELLEQALQDELAAGTVIEDTIEGIPAIFVARLHRLEERCATMARGIVRRTPPWAGLDIDQAIDEAQRAVGINLSPSQRAGLELLMTASFGVLTGGPGVGKTTTVNTLIRVLERCGGKIRQAAPTGKAAKRMMETTGRPAETIHRMLGAGREGFQFNEKNPIECDVLIVDETSMIDVPMFHALLSALPKHAALILVGDVDQLPSVGPGRVLQDVIESGLVPVARLTEIHRQAAGSKIITNAHRINTGEKPDLTNLEGTDFFFVQAKDGEDAAAKIKVIVKDRLPKAFGYDPIKDIQVLSPMKKSPSGTLALNIELQSLLNPTAGPSINRHGTTFAIGDKVMQVKNNYDLDVRNGDCGIITGIDLEEGLVTISYEGVEVKYEEEDLDEVNLAYAYTIHKSQGSEAPCIVIPITTQHYTMLERNLLYTGVTRGRKLVVLVGQEKAIQIAVRTAKSRKRWSKLRERLAAA